MQLVIRADHISTVESNYGYTLVAVNPEPISIQQGDKFDSVMLVDHGSAEHISNRKVYVTNIVSTEFTGKVHGVILVHLRYDYGSFKAAPLLSYVEVKKPEPIVEYEAPSRGINLHTEFPDIAVDMRGANYYIGDSDISVGMVRSYIADTLESGAVSAPRDILNDAPRLTPMQRDSLIDRNINPICCMWDARAFVMGNLVVAKHLQNIPEVLLWDYILRVFKKYVGSISQMSTQAQMLELAQLSKRKYGIDISLKFLGETCTVSARPAPMYRAITVDTNGFQEIAEDLSIFYDDAELRYGVRGWTPKNS